MRKTVTMLALVGASLLAPDCGQFPNIISGADDPEADTVLARIEKSTAEAVDNCVYAAKAGTNSGGLTGPEVALDYWLTDGSSFNETGCQCKREDTGVLECNTWDWKSDGRMLTSNWQQRREYAIHNHDWFLLNEYGSKDIPALRIGDQFLRNRFYFSSEHEQFVSTQEAQEDFQASIRLHPSKEECTVTTAEGGGDRSEITYTVPIQRCRDIIAKLKIALVHLLGVN